MARRWLALVVLSVALVLNSVQGDEDANTEKGGEGNGKRYQVAVFEWEEVQVPYTIALWILLASVAKIGFHISKRFADIFPDSSLLIMVGLIVGIILSLAKVDQSTFSLDSQIFFLYLLPPIVFDAGYFMPNRAFFDNLGTILVFAVIGTLWNMATIGLSLWAIGLTGVFSVETPLLHVLLFTSLISAVDPVAVIVVFEEIHVNEVLFISVFGESLLNDAVTVVLYQIFRSFSEIGAENLLPVDFVTGGISFFVVALGGVLIGLIWAFIVCFTTKYTKHVKILNPVFVFLMPYCAYLTAEMFGLSAIMAVVFCGIAMKQYIKLNISSKAITSIKYFTKMLSGSSETVIFMFLGLSTVSRKHHWDTAFVALTVLFCLVYRALGVVIQCFFLNRFRLVRFSKVDQFVMAYGGLRGAIAYGLVVAMPDIIPAKDMMITACIVVIYFTVFLQGMTMKPLVNFLKVEKEEKRKKNMTEYIFERLIDYTMAGIEDICGNKGHHWLRDSFETFNNNYLKPILVKKSSNRPQDSKIVREYTRMTLKEASDIARGRIPSHQALSGIMRTKSKDSFDSMTEGINGSALGNTYNNPAFDMNSIDPIRSERLEHASLNKHLDMGQMQPKKHHFGGNTREQINKARNDKSLPSISLTRPPSWSQFAKGVTQYYFNNIWTITVGEDEPRDQELYTVAEMQSAIEKAINWQKAQSRRHLYSRHNVDVDSLGADLGDTGVEKIHQMGLSNIDPRNDGQDSYLYQPDSDPKKVSFTLASGSLTGRNYGAGARAASPPSRDGPGHQLTAAETELPWKRPDSHPAVPAWRSANPDLDEDDDEDEDDGEKILRMSAASSSAASSNEDTYRNQHEKVDEVKIDIHAVP